MQSPRIGVVFWLGQCDKENHGWREGPPLTVSWLEFRSVEGLHPPGIFNSNEKKNTAVCRHPQTHSFWGLAGLLLYIVHNPRRLHFRMADQLLRTAEHGASTDLKPTLAG